MYPEANITRHFPSKEMNQVKNPGRNLSSCTGVVRASKLSGRLLLRLAGSVVSIDCCRRWVLAGLVDERNLFDRVTDGRLLFSLGQDRVRGRAAGTVPDIMVRSMCSRYSSTISEASIGPSIVRSRFHFIYYQDRRR